MVAGRRLVAVAGILFALMLARGYGADSKMQNFPLQQPLRQDWSFSGPLGKFDKAQLKRGLKVYREVCAACHSLNYVAFRHLSAIGYDSDQINAIARQFTINDGPNQDGEMFTRDGVATDFFPKPFANDQMAASANNGAVPPDLSLIAKARAVAEPFPGFVKDLFTNYLTAGPDYIVALLNGYQEAPPTVSVADGSYYNPYFISGATLAMAPPLADGMVEYDDGAPQTVKQYAKDVAAFLMWSADPHMETRKKIGFRVISFLIVFAILLYGIKRNLFRKLNDEEEDGNRS